MNDQEWWERQREAEQFRTTTGPDGGARSNACLASNEALWVASTLHHDQTIDDCVKGYAVDILRTVETLWRLRHENRALRFELEQLRGKQ